MVLLKGGGNLNKSIGDLDINIGDSMSNADVVSNYSRPVQGQKKLPSISQML